jgi:hypothetical protein
MLFIGVTDFNVLETTGFFLGWFNAYWKAGVCPTDGLPATAHFPALCDQVPRTLSDTHLFASRPIPVYGLRPTDLSGKLARHRDLPAGAFRQALPSRYMGRHCQEHTGGRQREPRLAYLPGFRPQLDPDGSQALCRGQLRPGIDTQFMRSTQPPSTCAWRYFRGRAFANTKVPSSSIRCST